VPAANAEIERVMAAPTAKARGMNFIVLDLYGKQPRR
jgi:hypothetical protein